MIDYSICQKCRCIHLNTSTDEYSSETLWCAFVIITTADTLVPNECRYKLEHLVNNNEVDNDSKSRNPRND